MATTDGTGDVVGARTARRGRRAGTAALAGAAIIGLAVTSAARGSDSPLPDASFWALISAVGHEVDPPQDVTDLAQRSDAIVVAHVSDVRDGREERGELDPTPVLSTTVPLPRTVYVELQVDRVVSGTPAVGSTLTLEMFAPPAPLSTDDLRARMPSGQQLFFLWNEGTRATKAGYGNVVDPVERGLWRPASTRGVVAQGSSGLVEPLAPDDTTTTFLDSFGASTVDGAATATEQALR